MAYGNYTTNDSNSGLYPFYDEHLVYNLTTRQYILTNDAMIDYANIDLNEYFDTQAEVDAFLIEISDDIYEFIYQNSIVDMVKVKRYQIAKDPELREDFKKALINHARSAVRSSTNLLKDLHGIDIEQNNTMDYKAIRGEVGIGGNAVRILRRTGLLYMGRYEIINYVEDGTY
jgi:hypothetical protein